MSREERVGQLFMVGVGSTGLAAAARTALSTYRPGSVILTGPTRAGVEAVRGAVDAAVAAAGRVQGAAPLVSVDQEGGLVQRLKGPGFSTIPSAREQAQQGPTLAASATTWGKELAAAGVNVDLAPVADVVPSSIGTSNKPIGALRRGYGSDPAAVGASVSAFVSGMGQAGVATTVKHFPGLGKVVGNTDFTADVHDTDTSRSDADLAPFAAGVAAGAMLMVSSATYDLIDPTQIAAFSPVVIKQMVRADLRFDGVVVSDDLGAAVALSSVPFGERAVRFLRAGGDLVLTVEPATLAPMVQAVLADPSLAPRVDQSALRVLVTKERLGLLTC